MSVSLLIGILFFYNGCVKHSRNQCHCYHSPTHHHHTSWHNEQTRVQGIRKKLQHEFDHTVDFMALKNVPAW